MCHVLNESDRPMKFEGYGSDIEDKMVFIFQALVTLTFRLNHPKTIGDCLVLNESDHRMKFEGCRSNGSLITDWKQL